MPAATKRAELAAADALATSVTAAVRRRTGSMSLAGQRIAVGAKPEANGAVVAPTSGAGALAIVSNGSRAHVIGHAGKRLRVGNGWVTGPVHHPGTTSTGAFGAGIRAGMSDAEAAAQAEWTRFINGK